MDTHIDNMDSHRDAHMGTHAHAHIHTHARTHAHTHTYTHTHARARTHRHTRTHARTHPHTHTHPHQKTNKQKNNVERINRCSYLVSSGACFLLSPPEDLFVVRELQSVGIVLPPGVVDTAPSLEHTRDRNDWLINRLTDSLIGQFSY